MLYSKLIKDPTFIFKVCIFKLLMEKVWNRQMRHLNQLLKKLEQVLLDYWLDQMALLDMEDTDVISIPC